MLLPSSTASGRDTPRRRSSWTAKKELRSNTTSVRIETVCCFGLGIKHGLEVLLTLSPMGDIRNALDKRREQPR